MRHFELFLKVLFLIGSLYAIKSEIVSPPFLIGYLLVCFILGVVLICNKHASYNFKQTKKDLIMRRIEGGLLVLFSMFVYVVQG